MKHILIALIFMVFSTCLSQENTNSFKRDSLLLVLKKNSVQDTSKVKLYNEIFNVIVDDDITKANNYNRKILELSKTLNFKNGLGYYYLNQAYINSIMGKSSKKSAQKALHFFSMTNDIKNILNAYSNIADPTNIDFGSEEEGFRVIKKALILGSKTTYYNEIADLYVQAGNICYRDKQLNRALKYFKIALKFYNKSKNASDAKSALYLYIAFVNDDLQNYKEALNYVDKANEIKVYASHNLEKALILLKLKKYNSALQVLYENKKLCKDNYQEINYNSCLIAEAYYNLKMYTQAIDEILKIFATRNYNFQIKYSSTNLITNCLIKQKRIKEAKKYNDEALKMLKASPYKVSEEEIAYLAKAQIDEALGDFRSSLVFYKRYYNLLDSINKKNSKEKINQLLIDFNVSDKDNKIRELNLIESKKNLELSNQRSYLYFSIFCFIVALLFLIFLRKTNQSSKKKNIIIERKNIQLENSLNEKEILLKEIHHRVKNNLQLVLSLLHIQSKVKDFDISDFVEISQSRIISMSLIHESLYASTDLTKVNFKDYIINLTQSIFSCYSLPGENIEFELQLDEVYLDIQKAIPLGLIINELINNAFKHAFKYSSNEGMIFIQMKQVNKDYFIIFKDNGVGISKKELNKKTLGVELVMQLIYQIDGKIEIDNTNGTQYTISFLE